MAVASTYNTGTVSINAGETVATGQGTSWLTAGIRPGDLYWAAGLLVRIAAINTNTSLTLAYPWPGASRVAAAYEIRYTPDTDRVMAASREMLTRLDANSLSPLFGLVPAADKGVLYTGAATAALYDLTAFARTLLDDGNQAAMQATLGLTGNGIANLTNGSFGSYISAASDFYAFADGFRGLVVASGSTNAPPATPGVLFWWVEQQRLYMNGATRLRATGYVSAGSAAPVVYEAVRAGDNTWGPWARVVNSRNTLGTVSQSGGVPTGAIIERGSNANGEYVRYADGTQICWQNFIPSNPSNIADGALFRANEETWTYPAAFVGNLVTAGASRGSATSWVNCRLANSTSALVRVMTTVAAAGPQPSLSLLAIGRWF